MKNNIKILIGTLMGAMIAFMGFFSFYPAFGNVTQQDPAPTGHRLDHYSFFGYNAGQAGYATTTAAATSTNILPYLDSNGRIDKGFFVVAGAESATLYFSRTATTTANTGSTKFNFQVSDNGTNWYDYNKILDTDTNATSTANYTIFAATSTTVVNIDLRNKALHSIRCILQNTTDGEGTCTATARY